MPAKSPAPLRFHLTSMAFAGGSIWAGIFLIAAILNEAFGYGEKFLEAMEAVYPRYVVGAAGIFLGTLMSLFVGALAAWMFAYAYNFFADSPGRKRSPRRKRPKRKARPRRRKRR